MFKEPLTVAEGAEILDQVGFASSVQAATLGGGRFGMLRATGMKGFKYLGKFNESMMAWQVAADAQNHLNRGLTKIALQNDWQVAPSINVVPPPPDPVDIILKNYAKMNTDYAIEHGHRELFNEFAPYSARDQSSFEALRALHGQDPFSSVDTRRKIPDPVEKATLAVPDGAGFWWNFFHSSRY
jgi:hypothetical protein